PDSPDAPIFPKLSTKSASKLSEGFRSVLADAGLAEPPNKRSTGKGRHAAREVSELSFHSLRHAFVSILKATRASQAVAMALAGNDTEASAVHYPTLDAAASRAAVNNLPDVPASPLKGRWFIQTTSLLVARGPPRSFPYSVSNDATASSARRLPFRLPLIS